MPLELKEAARDGETSAPHASDLRAEEKGLYICEGANKSAIKSSKKSASEFAWDSGQAC